MSEVRQFVEDDIDDVADLHRRVFTQSRPMTTDLLREYRSYFLDVFLNNPWRQRTMPSFVYSPAAGGIAGFIGVVPRPIRFRQQRVFAAVSSQFIVDPQARSSLAGARLLKAFLNSGQVLSIADEANDTSRALWESLGGRVALPYSIDWTRPLRPTQLAFHVMAGRRSVSSIAKLAHPLARTADALGARVAPSWFCFQAPSFSSQEMDSDTMLGLVSETDVRDVLVPEYDRRTLGWMVERLRSKSYIGELRAVTVRDKNNSVVGWYIAHAKRGAIGEVLRLSAKPQHASAVLDRLCYDMWRSGCVAVAGRLTPSFFKPLLSSSRYILRRRHWMLVHSTRPELLDALHRGDATLSRLEGEFLLRFR